MKRSSEYIKERERERERVSLVGHLYDSIYRKNLLRHPLQTNSPSYKREESQLATLIDQAGVELEERDDQPNTWHVEGGTNCASAATVSIFPVPNESACLAMSTWNVGRPVEVD